MLIVKRKIGESFLVGNDVTVKVLGVRGGQVRIGVDAPREIEVYREEIYERLHRDDAPGARAQAGAAGDVDGAAAADAADADDIVPLPKD